jgi:hypothetical protein
MARRSVFWRVPGLAEKGTMCKLAIYRAQG